jgi:hypothetical protein
MRTLLLLALFVLPKDTCYTGLYIKNLYDIRPEEYAYTADFWVWFNYRNKKFDPLKNVELINAKQVSFSDAYYAKEVASESGKATLIHDWKLKNYPFDRQTLRIELEAGLDTSKMLLLPEAGNFKLYKGLELPGWRIVSVRAKGDLVHYDTDFGEQRLKGNSTFSRIHYTIEIQRKSWGLFFKLLIGLYISFFVAYLVFFIPPVRDQRFSLSIGGLFAAVGNKYVMDNNIPSTISFSFVDKIHDLTFLFILGTLILSVISLKIAEKNEHARQVRFDKICARVVIILYLLMNTLLIAGAYIGG